MTLKDLIDLAWRSVTDPASVARQIMGLGLSRSTVLMALALAVVVNTLMVSLQTMLLPSEAQLFPILTQPIVFAVAYGGILVLSIWVFTQSGKAVGGKGRLEAVGVLFVWLQVLRAMVQGLLLVVAPILPALGALISLAAAVAGIWILLSFLAEAHGFSRGKAALTLLLGVVGMALGLSLLLTLSGVTTTGLTGNV